VYHIVTGSSTNNTAILDGFTITKGNANGTTGNQGNGGGVYVSGASPTLRNITFRDNNGTNGGALYNESGSNPVLIDTLFEYNTAAQGAAIYNDLSSPQITDATFRLNTAINNGGAIYNTGSSNPTIVNTVFSRNSANTGGGGAVYNNLSNPNFINTTFSNNVAITGGAFANNSSSVAIRNSILYGNQNSSGTTTNQISGGGVTVANSIIQGGGFTGATDNNPLFVNANADDLRLKAGSPALNAGDVNLLPADSRDLDGDGNTTEKIPLDLAVNTRVAGANVDLVAYEGAELSPTPTPANSRTIFVRANAGGTNNGTSWVDAFTDLQGVLSRIKLAKSALVWLGIIISLEFTSPSASAAIFDNKTTFETAASVAGNLALETFDSFTGPIFQLSSLGITFNPMNAGIQPHSILANCPGPAFSSPNVLANNNACAFPGRGSIASKPTNPSNGIVGIGFFNTGGDDVLQLSAFDASNNLIEQATVSGSSLNPNAFKFLGVVTSTPASRIEISPVGGNGIFSIDNLQVATKSTTPVPEPSTILGIVTLGLGALLSKKYNQDDN
jgi:predicted outer membrane repeat protein